MSAIKHVLTITMSGLSLSPRENRAGREPERGAFQPDEPPLLHFAEEREKNIMTSFRNVLRRI